MTSIVTVLTPGFADWETALLNAVSHGFYKVDTKFATPGGHKVTSSGGMTVEADLKLEDIDLDKVDAVVICGGSAWQAPGAPDLKPLLDAAKAKNKVIGLICDGTVAAAKTGLLDDIKHTSNGDGYLDKTGYKGKAHYQDVPYAVRDGNIITSPGTAPVSFLQEVMGALGLNDDNLKYYVGLHAAQFQKAA